MRTGPHSDSPVRDGPLPRGFTRFNRKFANPLICHVAGRVGPLTLVKHRGRRTGRAYATPVMSFRSDEGLLIGVVYGTSSDWVRNVLASDAVEVTRRGQTRRFDSARLIGREDGLQLLPGLLGGPFRVFGVRFFVHLTDAED